MDLIRISLNNIIFPVIIPSFKTKKKLLINNYSKLETQCKKKYKKNSLRKMFKFVGDSRISRISWPMTVNTQVFLLIIYSQIIEFGQPIESKSPTGHSVSLLRHDLNWHIKLQVEHLVDPLSIPCTLNRICILINPSWIYNGQVHRKLTLFLFQRRLCF